MQSKSKVQKSARATSVSAPVSGSLAAAPPGHSACVRKFVGTLVDSFVVDHAKTICRLASDVPAITPPVVVADSKEVVLPPGERTLLGLDAEKIIAVLM